MVWVLEAPWVLQVVWALEDQEAMDLAVMDPPAMVLEETWVVTTEVQWGRQEGVQWHLAITTWEQEDKAQVQLRETQGCNRSRPPGL